MTRPAAVALDWGPEVIGQLLPQRAPFVFVDRVARFVPGPRPRMHAGLRIRGDEPVLAAHFPGRPIWPGVYLLEGLAQAAGLLLALERIHAAHGAAGLEHPAIPELERQGGLLARAEVRFVRPVEPPAELVYVLRRRGGLDGIERVDGRVELEGEAVAEASLVLALEPSGEAPG